MQLKVTHIGGVDLASLRQGPCLIRRPFVGTHRLQVKLPALWLHQVEVRHPESKKNEQKYKQEGSGNVRVRETDVVRVE